MRQETRNEPGALLHSQSRRSEMPWRSMDCKPRRNDVVSKGSTRQNALFSENGMCAVFDEGE